MSIMISFSLVTFMSVPISHFSFRFVDSGLTWHGPCTTTINMIRVLIDKFTAAGQHCVCFVLVVFILILSNCILPSIKITWSPRILCCIQPGYKNRMFALCVEGISGNKNTLLEIIALSTVQSFARIPIHNVILFINTSTMLGTTKVIG